MSYAIVNGLNMYYETHGDGRPLILIHGGLGSTGMFGPNLPALAMGRKVIAVDLQGHGRTADIDRPIHPKTMAGDVIALIEQLGLGKTDVMGYSLGGAVAMWVAILRPDLVRKVVAASTVLRRDAFYPDILEQQKQVNANAAEWMKQTPIYTEYAKVAPRVEDFPVLLEKVGAFMKEPMDATKEVASIKVPVMIVQGDSDIVPPSHAVELFGLLGGGKKDGGWTGEGVPKSRLAILPGVTHYAMGTDPGLAAVAIPFLDAE
ncbi:MAG TPA: alpha/beta hydrolase [Candidatus Limnocylindrales bacterium]|nr:alpha/beta hydrolase [Candidatus Limnocylindrales bacterium]